MNNALLAVGFVGFVALYQAASSLWENPPAGRSPRQRRAGVFHRLVTRLLSGFFRAYGFLVLDLLYKHGAPSWLVNLPRVFVPDVLMRAAARAWQDRQGGRLTEPVSLAVFAAQHELTHSQALYLAKRGKILGATRQRNGSWMVFPPAILTGCPRTYQKRSAAPGEVAPPSGASDMAEDSSGHGVPPAVGFCRTVAARTGRGLQP